jgi:hypothetical protein
MSRHRNPAIARGDSRSSRRSDAPNPGRSIAKSRARSARDDQIREKAYKLSGHGLVNSITGFFEPPLSAYLIFNPSIIRNRGSIDEACETLTSTPLEDRRAGHVSSASSSCSPLRCSDDLLYATLTFRLGHRARGNTGRNAGDERRLAFVQR